MLDDLLKSSKRVLEPYDRVSEVLFGLIMVLTFTGSLSIAQAGREDIRAMLIGALGCNLAWGIIDGVLYLMNCLADQGKSLRILRAVRMALDPGKARNLLTSALPDFAASALQPAELETLWHRLKEQPEPQDRSRLSKQDWWGALAVFLLVFLSTLPVAVPFVVLTNATLALRVSNAIAVAMLFVAGSSFGRITGHRPWRMGVAMVILGLALVGITIALGG